MHPMCRTSLWSVEAEAPQAISASSLYWGRKQRMLVPILARRIDNLSSSRGLLRLKRASAFFVAFDREAPR